MNYQVFCGEYILHDIRIDDYRITDAVLTEELSKVKEFSFKIYPNHPYFDKLKMLIPNIKVYKDNILIFKGRIIQNNQNMDNSKQITCESSFAFLFDSIIRPYSFQGTPKDLFQYFINSHNNQVGSFEKTTDTAIQSDKVYFKYNDTNLLYEQVLEPVLSEINNYYEISGNKVVFIGKLTGADLDNNDYINRSSTDYLITFESIENKILDTVGGYLFERYSNDLTFIDWVDDFTDGDNEIMSGQTIEFGKNLMDLFVDNDASETYSVVIPLGAEIENEDGTSERLTIKDVNNNKDYIVNETALANYGWIVAPISETTWDDVTVASNLKTKAEEYLSENAIMLKSSLELSAFDLSVLDKNIDSFNLGEYVIVKSSFHDISKTYLLSKKTIYISDATSATISLGETKQTLTGIQLNDNRDNITRVENMLGDYVLNKDVTTIVEQQIENSSIIQQIPSQVMIQVEENYTSKEEFVASSTEASNNYQDIIGRFDDYATTASVSEITNRVENLTTSTEQAINIIENIQENGVTQVQTETGYTFNQDGLNIEKSNAPTGSKLDEAGLEVKDKTSAAETTQFYSGYVDEEMAQKTAALEDFQGQTVTYTNNLVFNNFLQSRNGRWEDVEDETYGRGIGIFVTGGGS